MDDDTKPEGQPDEGGESGEEQVVLTKAEHDQMKADLEHLKTQDRNFQALRNKQINNLTEEEKRKVLGDELESVKKAQDDFRTQQRTERIQDALDVFAGEDKEVRDKFEFYFNNDKRSDKAVSAKDVLSLMKEYQPLINRSSMVNSINQAAAHYQGGATGTNKTRFADSENGQALRKELGLPSALESAARNSQLRIKPEFLKKD